jgi:hypothetical protein
VTLVVTRQCSIQCDYCEQYGPAATTAVEARALAALEGWRVNSRRNRSDICIDCLDNRR